ncbi:MAG: formate dehydrogenase subunit delta [Zhongshania sp.]|uniref:formate dehydrogenase subunit delta n=1 Tax=Zhongshania sp. TaxID=1971902 RepID=UPI00260D05E8|nr:formate dehydrogenase subunit delta [Zhongshania sp.]MDF1690845.1 formate dehydrogenase subunit delta [Zhongshania sp.]
MSSAHSKSVDNLIRMANDIAENLRHGASDDAIAAEQVANHIRRFWARAMKLEIKEYLKSGGADLNKIASTAIGFI